ncbi:FecCD family ABC transporter permease [Novosphingobium naphthalenivorans]|uniref:FecCD family ABC transporter permease n=1 Tax=Novosphingobium naphthalenivorans TaxID=273168 RepID=UPI0008301E0C|nr:iron ABC transporter permease [Novosphingobium naphthalenivorans]
MRRSGTLSIAALPLLAVALLATVVAALCIGRFAIGPGELLALIWPGGRHAIASDRLAMLDTIVWQIRLPRIAAAVLVGASLSASGAAFQTVFRNPLVSPGLLGVGAGAGFGAALGMLLSLEWTLVQLLAFGMGLLAVGIAAGIARIFGGGSPIMLVLGGILTAGLFNALLSLAKYVADPYDQLPAIVYWLMGTLSLADPPQVERATVPILLGIGVLVLLGRALDALSMGDDEARTLGVPVGQVRAGVIAAATLISALTVSIAGMIGWIGLVVPHLARLLLGPGNTRLIPASAMIGAILLVAADGLARGISTVEIPIGIITELLGIPIFLAVLHRVRRGWGA